MSKQIPLTKGQFAIVDDDDYEWLNQWKWQYVSSRNKSGYARRTIQRDGVKSTVAMHRLIANALPGTIIDHIDRNTLNNQRINLRVATPSLNSHNTGSRAGTSVYKGVCLHRKSQRWYAQITIDGKTHRLGYFRSETDAAIAYNAAALGVYGSGASINAIRRDPDEHLLGLDQSSKYKGVSFRNDQQRWRSYVSINKRRHYLGQYSTEEEAARAYDTYVVEHGLDRPLNFPD